VIKLLYISGNEDIIAFINEKGILCELESSCHHDQCCGNQMSASTALHQGCVVIMGDFVTLNMFVSGVLLYRCCMNPGLCLIRFRFLSAIFLSAYTQVLFVVAK
jgi:hypothetical protein